MNTTHSNNSFFYCDRDIPSSNTDKISILFNNLQNYSLHSSRAIYILNKPLSADNLDYLYNDSIIILCHKTKPVIVNLNKNTETEFNDFFEDFIDDLEYLSKKFGYQKEIGRKREWINFIATVNSSDIQDLTAEDFLDKYKIDNPQQERICDLLVSLLIGSINDVEKIGAKVPETLLDKVKHKIVLYDGLQSKFIYSSDKDKSIITIQGLAGTGKTELLLHKIKELYVNDNNRIAFTCHNKVLANDLKTRVPNFFNFMKVNEQIKWNERLWVFPSWGSRRNPNSGLYSYLCDYYDIPFETYSYNNSFDNVCKKFLIELENKKDLEKCFDYIFIDESQDFSDDFFKICSMVVSKQVIRAGDIFQAVYDYHIVSEVAPDFLLNRCYRTDPRTLMIAHAIGMGLCEKEIIRWLQDKQWETCGYIREKISDNKYKLSREPISRFEDLENEKSIEILPYEEQYGAVDKAIDCISKIKISNPTLCPDDIGVIFLDSDKKTYNDISYLSMCIRQKFEWNTSIGFETKNKITNCVYISNLNNIKGLEFPFIICIKNRKVSNHLIERNSFYMALTRSFITSFLIINSSDNDEFISSYLSAINTVQQKGFLLLREPTEEEKKSKCNVRIDDENVNMFNEEIIAEQIAEHLRLHPKLNDEQKNAITVYLKSGIKNKSSVEDISDMIESAINNYEKMLQ